MIKPKALLDIVARLPKKQRLILSVVSICVVLALLAFIVVIPIFAKLAHQKDEIRQKIKTIKLSLHIASQKEYIQRETQKFAPYFSTTIPEEENITMLLKEAEVLANKSSLSIVDMKPVGIKEDKDSVKKCVITLSAEGQMEQIMDFMFNVENSNSLLVIERYQISPKSRESSIAQCSMTISKIQM